jgi:long-chain acyl-CoA synthetase
VKGRTVFAGYWGQPALTLAAFRDGWFFTGDVARYASDGHIVQLDREVDVIHTSNGPAYSLPIEETIHKHPAVFDVCVYGARQPDGTQAPAAAIALRPGFDVSAEALRDELNAHLAPADRLRDLAIMEWADFPVGITGKTLKRVFRELSQTALYER